METENNNEELPPPVHMMCSWCHSSFLDTDECEASDYPDEDTTEWQVIDWRGTETYICEPCYDDHHVRCDDCSCSLHAIRDGYSSVGCDYVCEDCISDHYTWCDGCDEYRHYDYPCDCNDNDGGGFINSYSYNMKRGVLFYIAKSNFSSNEPSGLVVTGFENEMECVNGDLAECAELAHDIYHPHGCVLKEDGSISHGFELVTSPMSLEYIQNVFPFDKMRDLAEHGMRSSMTTSCGLHVHINKGYFSNRHTSMYRFMAMFHRNNSIWQKIGGRTNSSYARWNDDEQQNMIEYVKYAHSQGIKGLQSNYERYVAINLQNTNSIELRFFKGTLRPLTLQARVEAVHAVAEYSVATRHNVNIKQAYDWERFRNWVASSKKYNAFHKYAETKGV
jgi:hypothetical protein